MALVQKFPWYIYDDRFTSIWEPYSGSDFVRYEVYVGAPGFTPGASNRKDSGNLTNRLADHFAITGLSAQTEYECIVRVVKTVGSEDSNRKHICTCEANEGIVIQDGAWYYGFPHFSKMPDGLFVATYGQSKHGVYEWASYYLMGRAYGTVPFFKQTKHDKAYSATNCPRQTTTPVDGDFPFGSSTAVRGGDGAYDFMGVKALDAYGNEWDDAFIAEPLHSGGYSSLVAFGKAIPLSDGSVLMTGYGSKDGQRYIPAVRSTDGVTYAEQGIIYLGANTKYQEPELCKISGTYPNERIVAVIRYGEYDTYKHFWSESLDSGRTWSALVETNINTRNYVPAGLAYDESAGRLYAVAGNRPSTYDSTAGLYLFYNDSITPTGFSARIKVQTPPAGVSVSHYGYGSIEVVGDELWICYYTCVGTPIGDGGTSNPFIAYKIFDKATLTAKPLTKYSYETDPYQYPTIAKPTLTRQPTYIEARSVIDNLIEGDTIAFFYRDADIETTDMPDTEGQTSWLPMTNLEE